MTSPPRILASYRASIRLGFVAALATLAIPAPAPAALMPFTGQLQISLGPLGGYAAVGAGAAEVSPGSLAFTLPPGVFPFSTSAPLTGLAPFTRLTLSFDNLTGSFAPGAGLGGGFGAAHFGMTLSGKVVAGFSVLDVTLVPIHLAGHGGSFPLAPSPLSTLSTVWGAWTTGTSARVIQLGSASSTTVTISGTDLRTPDGAGTISLVTPMTVFHGDSPFYDVPLHARLTLHFVPEPSPAALLACSALVSAWVGRQRQRRPRNGAHR